MDIHAVKFVKSSTGVKSCPHEGAPEYAFAGRSNVGKSSLLNLLVNMKNMAKISSTPGKTRYINHFMVNDSWYLVDLPGYGFARTTKSNRDAFLTLINEYLENRKTLSCLFILIDIRHKPLESDLSFINSAGELGIPLALVFTKADKLSAAALKKNLDVYNNTLMQMWESLPPLFITSSMTRIGRDEILDFIDKSNINFMK